MRQYDLALDKYWVTNIGYFRLATTVELGMGIIDGKLLLCHVISGESVDKKISMQEYNKRMIYNRLNNPFPGDCGRQGLNICLVTIDN